MHRQIAAVIIGGTKDAGGTLAALAHSRLWRLLRAGYWPSLLLTRANPYGLMEKR
jgi:hypothetical protein